MRPERIPGTFVQTKRTFLFVARGLGTGKAEQCPRAGERGVKPEDQAAAIKYAGGA